MLNKQQLPLSDFLNNLQTFDVVLMHGIFPLSLMSEEIEGSPYSHVGVVAVAGDLISAGLPLKNIDPETRLFWESNVTTELTIVAPKNFPLDVLLNTGKNGPQLTKLVDRMTFDVVNQYDTIFAGRRLTLNRTPAMFETFVSLILKVHGDLFPVAPDGTYLDGANFQLGRFQNKPVTDNTFFCSQLAARTYMDLGLLTQQYVDNSYCPADFAEAPDVSFLNGAWLGKETFLDPSTLSKTFPIPS